MLAFATSSCLYNAYLFGSSSFIMTFANHLAIYNNESDPYCDVTLTVMCFSARFILLDASMFYPGYTAPPPHPPTPTPPPDTHTQSFSLDPVEFAVVLIAVVPLGLPWRLPLSLHSLCSLCVTRLAILSPAIAAIILQSPFDLSRSYKCFRVPSCVSEPRLTMLQSGAVV